MANVQIEAEQRIELDSVGVDIGSATTHIVFSHLTLEKVGIEYQVVERCLTYSSPVILTPYCDGELIDKDALERFIGAQYAAAKVERSDIDVGALVLTGVALDKHNSRLIGEVFAEDAGRMVAVGAGDALECVLTAYGSGSVELSSMVEGVVLHCDIGGGTTKLVLCEAGEVVASTAVDVGARLLVLGEDRRVSRIEEPLRVAARRCGVDISEGAEVSDGVLGRLAGFLVDQLLASVGLSDTSPILLRASALPQTRIDVISLSGGVAEYVYGRCTEDFGDLGRPLAQELRARFNERGVEIVAAVNGGIRATVLGASQYSAHVSGSTIFVSSDQVLPLRNVQVVRPPVEFGELRQDEVARTVRESLGLVDSLDAAPAVGIAFDWAGLASYERIDAFARGLRRGVDGVPRDATLVLVCSEDVGGLVGRHLVRELGEARPVASIDCIELRGFDFIDLGQVVPGASVVPVVVKSLVFPSVASDSLPIGTAGSSNGR